MVFANGQSRKQCSSFPLLLAIARTSFVLRIPFGRDDFGAGGAVAFGAFALLFLLRAPIAPAAFARGAPRIARAARACLNCSCTCCTCEFTSSHDGLQGLFTRLRRSGLRERTSRGLRS